MIVDREFCPQRLQSGDLVVEELPNELMVYDPARNKAFCLNEIAGFVWQHSDGETSVAEIATLLGARLKRDIDEQVVWYALETLSKDGLLGNKDAELPRAAPGVTRRVLLQRFGLGAAMSVPLVTAMMVAPAKAHASSCWTAPGSGVTFFDESGNQSGNRGDFWKHDGTKHHWHW